MQFPTHPKTPNFPMTSRLAAIPDGKAGTLVTLKLMRELARAAKKSLPVRTLAVELTNGNNQKDWIGELKSLHAFVRDKIRYVKDVRGVETLQIPEVTMQTQSGDCDDKSLLLASLLEAVGHPTRFVAIGFQPDDFEHVFVESRIGNSWIPLETTEPVEIGWTPKNVVARMVVHN